MVARILCVLGMVGILLPVQHAKAYEVLTAQELASHCKVFKEASDSVDGQYCIHYIQGFLDGAITTDARVLLNIESELAKETFSQRAIRLRAPDRGLRGRSARYAEFCLGDPAPLLEVVDKITADLLGRKYLEADISARELVYASLRKHYPCRIWRAID